MKRLALLLKRDPKKREYLAYRMKRSTITINRWARGEHNPSPAELEKLIRILKNLETAQSVLLLKSIPKTNESNQ